MDLNTKSTQMLFISVGILIFSVVLDDYRRILRIYTEDIIEQSPNYLDGYLIILLVT
jgi:hypothetical protein